LLSADLTYYTCFGAICQEVFSIFFKKFCKKIQRQFLPL